MVQIYTKVTASFFAGVRTLNDERSTDPANETSARKTTMGASSHGPWRPLVLLNHVVEGCKLRQHSSIDTFSQRCVATAKFTLSPFFGSAGGARIFVARQTAHSKVQPTTTRAREGRNFVRRVVLLVAIPFVREQLYRLYVCR